jgi:cytochrome b561
MTDAQSTAAAPAVRYSLPAIILHWTSFALVVFVGALGLSFDLFPRGGRLFWINIHAIFGLAVLVIALARLSWRMRSPPPDYPAGTPAFAKRLSQPAHLLLYALMIILPIVGIVAFIWHARVFDFGLFKLDFGVASSKPVYGKAEEIHELLAYSLFGLAGLHGLAALWHHFVRKDGLLARMWPGESSPKQSS